LTIITARKEEENKKARGKEKEKISENEASFPSILPFIR
jgi:hypothetical protein